MQEQKEALVIVAHPDDETIWMGGTILRKYEWNWTIISLSRVNDPDRAPKFKRVCEFFQAKPIISNLDDEHLQPLPISEIEEKIKSLLPKKDYDIIYTHGANGEYGHLRHKEVHKAVNNLIEKRELSANQVFFFSYEDSERSPPLHPDLKIQIPNENADLKVSMSEQNLKDKIKIITELYGFHNGSFETQCCHNMQEAFDIR